MLYANNKNADQPAHHRSLISIFVICCLDSTIYVQCTCICCNQSFNTLASLCSCADRFVSYLVKNPEDRFPHDAAQKIDLFTPNFTCV